MQYIPMNTRVGGRSHHAPYLIFGPVPPLIHLYAGCCLPSGRRISSYWYLVLFSGLQYLMGSCVSPTRRVTLNSQALEKIRLILSNEEIFILHLMYRDLADRTVQRKINLQNFLLFFHKNGYWGERLFKEFDYDETNLISEEEFIHGIAKIFKSTEKEKISLLFKFFSKTGHNSQGVPFDEFLIMLYNYPKEDLKQILNDKEFIEFELKKRMVLIENRNKDGHVVSTYRLESNLSVKQNLANFTSEKTFDRKEQMYEAPLHSMIGKDIIKGIKDKYKTNQTVISFKDGDKVYDIRTSNIQQLVKKFALRIFNQAKIDVNQGKLNFRQFYSWISVHKTLYENYYDGFHHMIWEIDPLMKKPKYLLNDCEKASDARLVKSINNSHQNTEKIKVKLFLHHSILVICDEHRLEVPLFVVCLEGLTVKRIYEIDNGFGFQISHRDGIYEEKQIFLKNEELLFEWMQLLKYYKGQSVQKKYEIGGKIGTGKFSVVYRCRHIAQNKQYAIKQIATFKLEADAKNLIAHESSIMQIISHPLLLEFKECIQTKTHIYIVTELVNGKDLFEFVKESEYLQEYDAAKITQQIIVGIRFLHSFEIVHRDLKPENIMVVIDEDSQEISNIKIIDFGFSNYLSKLKERTSEELLAGTPNYIAPEVLREEDLSFKIDNFAIGVMLYFMLTGALPFNDYNITEILQNTIKGEYRYSDKRLLSKESMDLIDKLLKNKPEERINLEDALKHPWFDILKQSRKHIRTPKIKKKAIYDFLK